MSKLNEIQTAAIGGDGRIVADRRRTTWRTVVFGYLRSRRRATRRAGETPSIFTDWHHPWLFFLATGTMILSCMDAFFTMQLLDRGAMEVNPFMDAAIGRGTLFFASVKVTLTAFGILVLVFLANSRFMDRFRSGIILTASFSFYACLVCYEFVYLLSSL